MPAYRVLLFATLRDLAGQKEVFVSLPPEATVADLRRALAEQFSSLQMYLPTAVVAANHAFTTEETVLHPHDEIAVFPPVSGG